MKQTTTKPNYPFSRIEGDLRETLLDRYSPEIGRDELKDLVMELAAKDEDAPELPVYAEGFARGLLRDGDKYGRTKKDIDLFGRGPSPGGHSNKWLMLGYDNGWFTSRALGMPA